MSTAAALERQQRAQEEGYEVVVDVGGTRTKFGYRSVGSPVGCPFQRFKVNSSPLFEDPKSLVDKVLEQLLEKGNITEHSIRKLVFSITGEINSIRGTIEKSERLNEFAKKKFGSGSMYNNFAWVDAFERRLPQLRTTTGGSKNILILNDAMAHALGSFTRYRTLPLVTMTLGTMPTLAVVRKDDDNDIAPEQITDEDKLMQKIRVYSCEKWTQSTREPVKEGGKYYAEKTIAEVLSKNVLRSLKEKNIRDEIERRVANAVLRLEDHYLRRFRSLPAKFVISGGTSQCIEHDVPDPRVIIVRDEAQQLQDLFEGCIYFQRDFYNIKLFTIGLNDELNPMA